MKGRGWLWFGLGLAPAACIACQWLLHAALVEVQTTSARTALGLLAGVPHAAINILLAGVFGRTLLGDREALITGFARRVHGTLTADIERYTRRVTLAWCVFFSTQVLVSAILFAAVSLQTWSFFVTVLSAPLIALMFVAEYLYRILRFPDHAHASIWKGVQQYVGHARRPHGTEARSQN